MHNVSDELKSIGDRGLFRSLENAQGLDFASNDYLGFARNHQIREKLIAFLHNQTSLGATGSRLISGNSQFIEDTEHFIAERFGAESCILFGSGYLANLGVMSALGGEETEFFSDEYNHASIIDGIRLSNSACRIFGHNNVQALESRLRASCAKRKVIVSESIFSMDGDCAPLDDLERLARDFDAYLVIDEAHATGAAGKNGLGLSTTLSRERLITVHPCGKAIGAYGAFVCCSHLLKEYFINKARSFIFTTALPPLSVAHMRFALEEITTQPTHRDRLRCNVELCESLFNQHGFSHSGSHIVPFIVGANETAIDLARQLNQRGFFVKALRFPSVPKGSARLRLTLKSSHNSSDIQRLCNLLKELSDAHFRYRH